MQSRLGFVSIETRGVTQPRETEGLGEMESQLSEHDNTATDIQDGNPAAPFRRSRWHRFTIASLLFLMVCAAGTFLGFRYGLSVGVEAQLEKRLADEKAVRYSTVYMVSDLIPTSSQEQSGNGGLDQLVGDIENALGIEGKENAKGSCVIAAGPPDTLLVSASSANQDQVKAYIAGRRARVSGTPKP